MMNMKKSIVAALLFVELGVWVLKLGQGQAQGEALSGGLSRISIASLGAVGDGATLNTMAIQNAIDQCAKDGGGTVVVPAGRFISGALFLQPGVDFELETGAVLCASTDIKDFPTQQHVRFEGHFSDHASSLLNVEHCDGFKLAGNGELDGNGAAYWKSSAPGGRPRLCEICDSQNVVVSGVRFYNSPSWNLHFYNCRQCVVDQCRFEIAPHAKGPSTDGTDIDSSQGILVTHCFYSVNDDCICLKGNRYDGLHQMPPSPPVEDIHIKDCIFARGQGALSLGTEATIIRNVEFENSVVQGKMPMLRIKFRPDTAGQHYSNIHVQGIRLDGTGRIVSLEPTHGTKVPVSKVPISDASGIVVEDVSGHFGSFGSIAGGSSVAVSDVLFQNIQVGVSQDAQLDAKGVTRLRLDRVKVTGS